MMQATGPASTWAYCRALAAAVLGDANAISFVNLTGKTRFPALASGEIDVLSRNTTWTYSRDVDLGFTFVGVNYYDGQGFIGRTALGIGSATELDGASVCIQTGTTTELNLADFFRVNGITYEPVPIETNAEARAAYEAERCDVYTTDASGLAATKTTFDDPSAHMVFPEIVSKEPLGPLVRQGDDQWADIARWTPERADHGRRARCDPGERGRDGRGCRRSSRDQPDAGHRRLARRDDRPRCAVGGSCDRG